MSVCPGLVIASKLKQLDLCVINSFKRNVKGLEFLLVKMATGGATPRKFAEKIAMHNQKGAEENAEFQKIMSEIARVKGNAAMPSPRVSPDFSSYKTNCFEINKKKQLTFNERM